MPTRNHKRNIRGRHGGIFEINRANMTLEVMYGYEGLPQAVG
jgi:hypothetical protein